MRNREMAKASCTVQTTKELLDKFDYIAKQELRSRSKELEQLIKRRIAEFEKVHGTIEPKSSKPEN